MNTSASPRSPLAARLVLATYVTCFAIGVASHARDFIVGGWLPYRFGPPLLNGFWTTLIGADAAVILLLVTGRRRAGLALALLVMILDVSANSYAWIGLRRREFAYAVPLQSLFLGFVVGSIGFLWPRSAEREG